MKKFLKWFLIVIAVLLVFFLLVGMFSEDEEGGESPSIDMVEEDSEPSLENEDDIENLENTPRYALENTEYSTDDTWAIYWYLCGSDLESEGGAATADLEELIQVTLPENVQVVIQTGGAYSWENDSIDSESLGRYLYAGDELQYLESQSMASMGKADTLQDFLEFCNENYPADHQAVIFWNHGGGSVSGVAFDELYDYDSLTLGEMYQAFSNVYEVSSTDQPIELIGFDTCLMSTIDTAYTFADVAKYMVASEELEPGNGWYYCGWLQELADHPDMNGAQLGRAICDSFVEGCEIEWTEDSITLAVTDLSAVQPLLVAYDNVGKEALKSASENETFITEFARNARSAENYGGNSKEEGYTNMVDLGDLVRNSQDLLPETSDALLKCLDTCVIYKVNGPYRENSSGLSCYHSYNADTEDYQGFTRVGASEPFKYYYGYGISGNLTAEGQQFIEEMGYEDLPELQTLASSGLEEYPIDLNEEGCAVLDIGADTANILQAVYFQLMYVNEEEDLMMLLGRDNNLVADWDNGVFTDNFYGYWGAIDGHLVYMELVDEQDEYNIYAVPILLNGEEYNLRVAYNYADESYKILGARKGIDDVGMADKELRKLEEGDEITTIMYASSYSGDDDFVEVENETFTVSKDTKFEDQEMGDGEFVMMFEMVDMQNESAYSDIVTFYVEGDEITTEVYE